MRPYNSLVKGFGQWQFLTAAAAFRYCSGSTRHRIECCTSVWSGKLGMANRRNSVNQVP
jgi:hypothetical protein